MVHGTVLTVQIRLTSINASFSSENIIANSSKVALIKLQSMNRKITEYEQ